MLNVSKKLDLYADLFQSLDREFGTGTREDWRGPRLMGLVVAIVQCIKNGNDGALKRFPEEVVRRVREHESKMARASDPCNGG